MKIAITRLKEKAKKDAELCKKYGHACYAVSPMEASVYEDAVTSFAARTNEGEFDCIFFTSALPAVQVAPLLKKWPRVIAIGPQTAKTLESFEILCETLPAFYSRDFVPYLGDWIAGKKIGIPRADVPNPALISAIEEKGGIVCEVPIYSLVPTKEELLLDDADAIIFTSANSFSYAVWDKKTDIIPVAIGDITGERMREGGVSPAVTGDGSLEGTLIALNDYIGKISGETD
ncbi:uroporphyrinogen-III synthase [Methanoplanus sp. FWC-SCC4]|uniref:Uroporphyrinogen-III synthase n=1 Tax=Methanochimaera problematica TaxID=2609417 RepID=A0AA97FD41_9EURY|nr:uroporphyrinogen-III synthase [Methanoplanus sp. FWC-SCC4]WOF16852.1 uroporphyrinogen-III synthase [Methanoplanus sp. FWC-SCC4]